MKIDKSESKGVVFFFNLLQVVNNLHLSGWVTTNNKKVFLKIVYTLCIYLFTKDLITLRQHVLEKEGTFMNYRAESLFIYNNKCLSYENLWAKQMNYISAQILNSKIKSLGIFIVLFILTKMCIKIKKYD